jgi:hypothetical protein
MDCSGRCFIAFHLPNGRPMAALYDRPFASYIMIPIMPATKPSKTRLSLAKQPIDHSP